MAALDSVLTYRRHLLDQRKADLAKAMQADTVLANRIDAQDSERAGVTAEAAAASAGGPVDIAAVAARLLYSRRLQAESQQLAAQRTVVAERITQCREAVAKADSDVKAIERILEKRAAAAHKAALKREQLTMEDAFAARRHV